MKNQFILFLLVIAGVIGGFFFFQKEPEQSEASFTVDDSLTNLSVNNPSLTNLSVNNPSMNNIAITDGLVGHWTFDGPEVDWSATGSEIIDRSGNGNDGDASTSGMDETNVYAGKVGQGLSFNGSTDYINLGQPSELNFNDDFTLSAWVRPGSLPSGTTDIHTIVARISIYGNYEFALSYLNYYSVVNKFAVTASNGGGISGEARVSSSSPEVDTWTHVVGTYSASLQELHMYVNGVLDDGTLSGTPPTEIETVPDGKALVTIGDALDGAAYFFDGAIDDVRIYNRFLSAAEIAWLYRLGI